MKRTSYYLLFAIFSMLSFYSCAPETDFDDALLIGKWVSGTEYYKYNSGGTGITWDTADDVTEAEGQAFTWTLIKDELTHIHIMETGGAGVPKIYTVTELSATTLKYKDDYGKSYTFTKVN